MTYIPRQGSLPERVLNFFMKHQDEELSIADIAIKFEVNADGVGPTLGRAVAAGLLAKPKDGVFRAGPQLLGLNMDALQNPSGFKRWLAAKGLDEAQGRGAVAALPDPASIKIEPGVAIPEPMSAQQARYVTVFAAMKIGDSFEIPHAAGKTLINSARRWGKGVGRNFLLRRISESAARIWRTE